MLQSISVKLIHQFRYDIKETRNSRNTICNICHKTPAIFVYFYDSQMSIVKHFSVDSIKSEFENKQKVEF